MVGLIKDKLCFLNVFGWSYLKMIPSIIGRHLFDDVWPGYVCGVHWGSYIRIAFCSVRVKTGS